MHEILLMGQTLGITQTEAKDKMDLMEFERFSIYGFTIDYPTTWTVELDPRSKPKEGSVAFKSTGKFVITVSWGSLEKAKKYSSSDAHAEGTINAIKKSRGVKDLELLEAESIGINLHKASFRHVRVIVWRPVLVPFSKKTVQHEICSLHLHCVPSGRYFVIQGNITPEKPLWESNIFKRMISSFRCHNTNVD